MPVRFLNLSNDTVLDFLNTYATDETRSYEYLSSDQDVIEWMMTRQLVGTTAVTQFQEEGVLVKAAHTLRDAIRNAVFQKKSGSKVDIDSLNAFLAKGRYHANLVRQPDGQLHLVQECGHATPEQLLARIANAAADLLCASDFNLVRKCAAETCSLWFYDRTKAHRRRWCSMTTCGNRRKVAAYRARHKA